MSNKYKILFRCHPSVILRRRVYVFFIKLSFPVNKYFYI